MKILKKIFLGLLAIIALLLIVALFLKKDYAVNRQITINKPKQDVFNYIKYLINQNNYSKWATMDPNMKKDYRGTDGSVGFVSAWESKTDSVGKGEQEIKKITEGERIDFELRFMEPFESTDNAYMTTEALTPASTKVTWGFNGSMKYPTNLFLVVMNMEELLGGDLEIGLSRLKTTLEKQ